MRCAIYLRISKEELENGNESNSISGQRMIIRQYVNEHEGLEIVGEWCDDGYSGATFERPGIKSMLEKVLSGDIECVIVKDLSRFGRDYIQTGRYIRYIFPKLNVRFIAICDNYDSFNAGFFDNELIMPVLNLINDAYCRDISGKVKWQQEAKRKQGVFIGAFAVYGYMKSEKQQGKLVIDEEAAKVVKWIFEKRLERRSAEFIADELNKKNIPSPYTYKKINSSKYTTTFAKEKYPQWSPVAVRRILANEMYTGVMIQGKVKKVSYKLPIRKSVPKSEWVRVEGAVDAIISKELFEKVQAVRLKE